MTRAQGPSPEFQWQSEDLFFAGDHYFSAVWEACSQAQFSIEIETYIYESDPIGRKTLELLSAAAERGVQVRLLVDGVGSMQSVNWLTKQLPDHLNNFHFRVYKPLPYSFSPLWMILRLRFQHFWRLWNRINRRDHRKIFLFDKKILFISSFNISAVHSRLQSGRLAWRDTGVALQGAGIRDAVSAFDWAWRRSGHRWLERLARTVKPKLRDLRKASAKPSPQPSALLRLNYTRALRRQNYRDWLARMKLAEHRIWLENPYFVPNKKLQGALLSAAERGVDVRVVVPRSSDVPIVRWASQALYGQLIEGGVQIYEYLPSNLHAKVMIVDDWMTVGSSNWNHRSLLHDLEIDAILTRPQSHQALSAQFLRDLQLCEKIEIEVWQQRTFLNKCLGRLALIFRYWI